MGVEDGDFRGVLTYQDKEDLAENVISLAAPDAMVSKAYRQGFNEQIGGIPVLFTQQLANFTNGNDVTGVAVDGATRTSTTPTSATRQFRAATSRRRSTSMVSPPAPAP
jgi:hypothetical protein